MVICLVVFSSAHWAQLRCKPLQCALESSRFFKIWRPLWPLWRALKGMLPASIPAPITLQTRFATLKAASQMDCQYHFCIYLDCFFLHLSINYGHSLGFQSTFQDKMLHQASAKILSDTCSSIFWSLTPATCIFAESVYLKLWVCSWVWSFLLMMFCSFFAYCFPLQFLCN